MEHFFDCAKQVFSALADHESREIYEDMVLFNLTRDNQFVERHLGYQLLKFGINVPNELKYHASQPKIIFGAGKWGQRLVSLFPEVSWTCFADNNAELNQVNGLHVISLDEIKDMYPDAFITIAVTKYSEEIYRQLLENGVPRNNIWVLGKSLDIIAEKLEKAQYFDLPFLNHDEHEVFVDVGGFDGITSLNFVKWANQQYNHIYVFEANPEFYSRCKETLKIKDCTIFPLGLWSEEKELSFYESPHDSEYNVILHDHNCFDSEHEDAKAWIEHKIKVGCLDDILGDQRVTFIKMDIEGSEANALVGAENIVRKHKPKLAICVYHRRDDLWTIPSLILRFRPDYKLYLRHYSFSWGETVLYAV